MLSFLLSDYELIDLIRGVIRQTDGRLIVHIPVSKLKENAQAQPLVFADESRTVASGRLSVRLSPTQFALLKFISINGRTSFEQLQDAIWCSETSDDAIRRIIAKVNMRLLEAGFQSELLSHHGRVSLECVNA